MISLRPVVLDGLAVSNNASSTSPSDWMTAKKHNRIPRSWSMIFPKHRETTKGSNSNVSRGCEKRPALRKENAEERKESIVSAFMGFLRSWARVEGDGKS